MPGSLIRPDAPHWSDCLAVMSHEVYHLPEYVSFDAALNGGEPAAFLYRDRGNTLLLPLVLRAIPSSERRDAASPYGYPGPISDTADVTFWREAFIACRRQLEREGVVSLFVRLNPLLGAPLESFAGLGCVVTHGATVSIDTTLTREQWWPQVRKDHREAINRCHRRGYISVMDDWGLLEDFLDIYAETMQRVNATAQYRFGRSYFEDLRAALGDRIHLLMIKVDDETVAGSVLFEAGGVVQAHLAGTRTARRREEPSRMLVSEAVAWAHQSGYRCLHLGGGVGGNEDSIFQFKKGFSPDRHPFSTFRAVIDEAAYARLGEASNPAAERDDETAYFPAYRAPG